MKELKINGIYKHFKGDYYLVEGIAKDSETQEEMVIYRRLYEDGGLWVRPKIYFYRCSETVIVYVSFRI